MKHFINAISAIFYMLASVRVFRPKSTFRGKSVAIVGAANSVFLEKKGSFIDAHDIVIRINKAPHSWKQENAVYLGSKFTFLFHSFFENHFSGGGPIDPQLYKQLGIEQIINPNATVKGLRTHYNFYKRHSKAIKTYVLKRKYVVNATKALNGFVPTVGFSALNAVLRADCKSVYITGFTFFKTPYATGYRKGLETIAANKKHLASQGLHNPELELKAFKEALKNTPCDRVLCDEPLREILKIA